MTTFVYDFYDDTIGDDPLTNRRKPILFSISSLRRQNAKCNIVVYDSGNIRQNWHRYQHEFDFEVRYGVPFRFAAGYPLADGRSMQKLWHLTEDDFDDDLIALVSNNLIFLNDPGEESYHDYLCGGDREGIFFHNRKSPLSMLMLERWQSLCTLFMEQGAFQRDVFVFNKYRCVDEFVIMTYLLCKEVPTYWKSVPLGTAIQMHSLDDYIKHKMPMKSITLNESFMGFDKVSFIAMVKELSDATRCLHYLRDRNIGSPNFLLKDLTSLDKVGEMMAFLGLQGPSYFQFSKESLWVPPLWEIMTHGR